MKKIIAFLVFVIFGTTFYLKAQTGVLFFEEHIDFSIDSNYFCINGIYSFKNTKNRDINQQITFPFAEEATEITSTQLWGKPLETAVYTLTADKNIKIKTFSYLPDSIKEFEYKELYIWEKHNFMPKDDFEIILDK